MTAYTFNDGRISVGRFPRLYLAKGNESTKFTGSDLPGFCVITANKYTKNGKWSNTVYNLELAPGVRTLYFVSPMHGTWGDTMQSWGEVSENLGLLVEVAKSIIQEEFPRTAERLNRVEKFSIELEEKNITTETVVVSFGSPTNRAIKEGYWEQPKSGRTTDDQEVVVRPNPDWNNPEVVSPNGCKIINSKHTSGMHGGYWSIEVLVPIS